MDEDRKDETLQIGDDDGDGNGGPDPTPDPPPAPEPAGDDDPPASPFKGRLKQPADTNGRYVVLWALKPARGHRAAFMEIGYVQAHDPDHAKRIVLEEDGRAKKPHAERGDVARFLLDQAGAKGSRGILLRAVPAMHWPADVDTTTFVRPEPILQIG